MTIAEINKEISDLSNRIHELKQMKQKIEVEQCRLFIGSIIRCEYLYSGEFEDYQIVMVEVTEKNDCKFGLMDVDTHCIWHHELYNSLEDIKEIMMKNDTSLKWNIVKI